MSNFRYKCLKQIFKKPTIVNILKRQFGLTATVNRASSEVEFRYDGHLEIAPKISLSYAKSTDATSGQNQFDLQYQSYYQQNTFKVEQGQDTEETMMSRVVASSFVPAIFTLDLSDATFDENIMQARFFQHENLVDTEVASSEEVLQITVGGSRIDSQGQAEEAVKAFQRALQQHDGAISAMQGQRERMVTATFLNEQQAHNYGQAFQDVMGVDMATELVRFAKHEMIQATSMLMMQQAIRIGAMTLHYILDG